jgi:cytochrome c biogenesis protein CcmG/thiol:disulfide interchange protein DsbE
MARLGKPHVLPALIIALTAALLATLWPVFRDITGPAVRVGDEAPEFDLMSDTGRTIQLKDFQGKFLILNFWATWCPPCVDELPSLNRFSQRFAGQNVVVLGVSVDEDAAAYQKFLKDAGVQFPTVRDPARKVSRLYGTFKYPESYFIDRQGKVVQKIVGPADWDNPELVGFMQQLLRG